MDKIIEKIPWLIITELFSKYRTTKHFPGDTSLRIWATMCPDCLEADSSFLLS